MSKDLYAAPWSPTVLKEMKEEGKEAVKNNMITNEGREVIDEDGLPKAGYSAYGLRIKSSDNIK